MSAGVPGTAPNPATELQLGPAQDSIPQIVIDSVGEVRFRDPREDFYETGRTLENSLNVTGSLAGRRITTSAFREYGSGRHCAGARSWTG